MNLDVFERHPARPTYFRQCAKRGAFWSEFGEQGMSREYTKGMDTSDFSLGRKPIDISGQQHGDFVVVRYMGHTRWLCRCSTCGADKIVHGQTIRNGQMSKRCSHCSTITPAESDILALVSQGRTNKQIAHELTISDRTVQAHVHNLLAKFSVTNRTELAIAHNKRKQP